MGAGPDPAIEHNKARIKGAQFLDLSLVRDLNQPYPFMMPSQDWFIKIMKTLNVSKAHTVVVYETGQGWFANRAAFMFRAMGHPSVKVLDGQFAKWTKEGKPTEKDSLPAEEADFAYAYNGEEVFGYEEIAKAVDDKSV